MNTEKICLIVLVKIGQSDESLERFRLKYFVCFSVTECPKGTVLEILSTGSLLWGTDFSQDLDRLVFLWMN